MLTAGCYILSSLGDKHISAKLKFNPGEFAFIVSLATALWIGITLPFSGWQFEVSAKNMWIVGFLVLWKIVEFYTSAILLKTVSAYELKAWLGINILLSYLCNFLQGKTEFNSIILLLSGLLLFGIYLIITVPTAQKGKSICKMILLCIAYITSKFLYGLMFGMMSKGCRTTSVLLIVMIVTALLQLPRIHFRNLFKKKGLSVAAATRIPNAIGLITEAIAAQQNVFLYSLIQPLQLAVLFVISLVRKEEMSKRKRMGSILCIISIFLITILIQ